MNLSGEPWWWTLVVDPSGQPLWSIGLPSDFFFNYFSWFLFWKCINGQNRRWFCPAGHPGMGQPHKIPARPIPWQDFELVPLSLCPGTKKFCLSRCPEKLHCPVPLETLPATNQQRGQSFWQPCVCYQFCHGTSRDRGVCPGTFAPALVPGQRDSGTGKTFLSRDKGTTGQRDRETFLSRDKGTTGRPVPWKPYSRLLLSVKYALSFISDFIPMYIYYVSQESRSYGHRVKQSHIGGRGASLSVSAHSSPIFFCSNSLWSRAGNTVSIIFNSFDAVTKVIVWKVHFKIWIFFYVFI